MVMVVMVMMVVVVMNGGGCDDDGGDDGADDGGDNVGDGDDGGDDGDDDEGDGDDDEHQCSPIPSTLQASPDETSHLVFPAAMEVGALQLVAASPHQQGSSDARYSRSTYYVLSLG